MIGLPLIARAEGHGERAALVASEGVFTYTQLLRASGHVASRLLAGAGDLEETRVAFLTPPGFHYVALQWGIWRAGGVAVPLCPSHPRAELEYVIDDTAAGIIVAHPDFESKLRPLAVEPRARFLLSTEALDPLAASLPVVAVDRRAMIVYTSGTTGKPKGVVTTHANMQSQVECLAAAWEWSPSDRIFHVLPLHHVHGIVNALTCALWSGAACELLPRPEADAMLSRFASGEITVFMAVPTIYSRLIAAWEAADADRQHTVTAACARMRLMVSGSAALPVSVLEKWQRISGHVLLERYGTSETGMALSNPLHGERRPGLVGPPLPGVEVRLVDEAGQSMAPGMPGEIQVKSGGVFLEYWNQPEATRAAFCDGWYRTGDVGVVENGSYRILGRSSVDIIKTGGYKVSALEIEECLREHPLITDCAVVGVADEEWGERVAAAVVLRAGSESEVGSCGLSLAALRAWAKERLAPYKIPTRLLTCDELPRNAVGKVLKPEVAKWFMADAP